MTFIKFKLRIKFNFQKNFLLREMTIKNANCLQDKLNEAKNNPLKYFILLFKLLQMDNKF